MLMLGVALLSIGSTSTIEWLSLAVDGSGHELLQLMVVDCQVLERAKSVVARSSRVGMTEI
jgi:hypothetical protein